MLLPSTVAAAHPIVGTNRQRTQRGREKTTGGTPPRPRGTLARAAGRSTKPAVVAHHCHASSRAHRSVEQGKASHRKASRARLDRRFISIEHSAALAPWWSDPLCATVGVEGVPRHRNAVDSRRSEPPPQEPTVRSRARPYSCSTASASFAGSSLAPSARRGSP